MTNDKLIVELTNKAFVEIFGYSAQEIVGENIKVIIGDPVLRARHDEIVSSFVAFAHPTFLPSVISENHCPLCLCWYCE